MADTYEDFKKRYAAIVQAIDNGNELSRKVQQWTGQSSGILKEACKEIGKRVQELKDKGATGTALKDFQSDPEIQGQLKYINDFLARTETELKKMAAEANGPVQKAINDFRKLKKEMEEEIQKRKKKAS